MKPTDPIRVNLAGQHTSFGITQGCGIDYRNILARFLAEFLGVSFSPETGYRLPVIHFTKKHKILVSSQELVFRSDENLLVNDFTLAYGRKEVGFLAEEIHSVVISNQWISPLDLIANSEKFFEDSDETER